MCRLPTEPSTNYQISVEGSQCSTGGCGQDRSLEVFPRGGAWGSARSLDNRAEILEEEGSECYLGGVHGTHVVRELCSVVIAYCCLLQKHS